MEVFSGDGENKVFHVRTAIHPDVEIEDLVVKVDGEE